MEIAVVILNYNGRKHLAQFLPSVIQHSKEATIWVADNCSTDDSVNWLKEHHPTIKLLQNASNGGFAKGYNDALKEICADYYVLLNSDIEVTEGWIKPCIELLESNEKIAALQPKIRAFYKKDHFEHAGAAGGFIDKNYYPFCKGRIFEIAEQDQGQYDQSSEVFWATGACLFIKANLYHQVGGLDDDFFAHMEEIDLCWRLKSRGYQIWYCADATVYHVGGGTLAYDNPKKTYLNFRNNLYLIYKNHPERIAGKMFRRMCLDGIAGAMFLLKFQFSHFWAVLKAHGSYYKHKSVLKKQRAENLQLAENRNEVGIYQQNIVFKKFLSGIKYFSELDPKDFSK